MTSTEILDQLDAAAKASLQKRTPSGHLLPCVLRIPKPMVEKIRQLTREDWEARRWLVTDQEVRAIREGNAIETTVALKRILNSGGFIRIGVDIVDEGEMELVGVLERELATFLRELPRLFAEGYEGKHALIHGDQIHSIWDTFEDGYQAGVLQFGPGTPFAVQPIDQKFFEFLRPQEPAARKAV